MSVLPSFNEVLEDPSESGKEAEESSLLSIQMPVIETGELVSVQIKQKTGEDPPYDLIYNYYALQEAWTKLIEEKESLQPFLGAYKEFDDECDRIMDSQANAEDALRKAWRREVSVSQILLKEMNWRGNTKYSNEKLQALHTKAHEYSRRMAELESELEFIEEEAEEIWEKIYS